MKISYSLLYKLFYADQTSKVCHPRKKRADVNQLAKAIVDQTTGESPPATPAPVLQATARIPLPSRAWAGWRPQGRQGPCDEAQRKEAGRYRQKGGCGSVGQTELDAYSFWRCRPFGEFPIGRIIEQAWHFCVHRGNFAELLVEFFVVGMNLHQANHGSQVQ